MGLAPNKGTKAVLLPRTSFTNAQVTAPGVWWQDLLFGASPRHGNKVQAKHRSMHMTGTHCWKMKRRNPPACGCGQTKIEPKGTSPCPSIKALCAERMVTATCMRMIGANNTEKCDGD